MTSSGATLQTLPSANIGAFREKLQQPLTALISRHRSHALVAYEGTF